MVDGGSVPLGSVSREIVVRVQHLVKRYGTDVVAVDGVDLEVAHGEIVGLLGPNGAGKTTTIECIVGLRQPTEGTIFVLGVDPAKERDVITSRVAVQPQSASLLEFQTVRETVELFASFHPTPLSIESVLADTGLSDVSKRRVRKLSGGERRRLLLAVALIGDPDLLVLDEPSAGLDPSARQSLWALIESLKVRGKTVLLSTHHMDEATKLCDRVIIIVKGRVAAEGTPSELVRRHSSVSYVEFTVQESASSEDLENIVGSPYELHHVSGGVRIAAETTDPDGLIRRATFNVRVQSRDFAVRASSLEDVFLDIAVNGGPNAGN
ncbi:ABC transporter ATP-binding protein [Salinibacterium sp. NG22]|uniref:ABC transporter ATP-binding protein n=1 Tax=Salinibacterium sp. NG22 TaxID=2792040 RepID=UPI0018CD40C6|nr:ABC transporter ATP-binding protein [Salinibacterium sp. NG22]MBH0109953.1 ABC transporter ATP-binding protein [Salinibacterium sp. NG22]